MESTAQIVGIASAWYALTPGIRRLWIHEADDIYVTVALAPVGDSDDISPIWLARSNDWQSELQGLMGRRVQLDCIDGDAEAAPRDYLGVIDWRLPE